MAKPTVDLGPADLAVITRIYDSLMKANTFETKHRVPITEGDLNTLCAKAKRALSQDPVFLKLKAPVYVVGDLHGQFSALRIYFKQCGSPPAKTFLFLGDYVDRGPNSIEVIATLFCLKILHPSRCYLLRGNHESEDISGMYGFKDECAKCYSGAKVWKMFNDVFQYLPLAAEISKRIFCVHGGLSQHLTKVQELESIKRPIQILDSPLVTDLVWADPDPDPSVKEYGESMRGTSSSFGIGPVNRFLEDNDYDLICRGHQVVQDGFEFPFHPEQVVITVFSAANYEESGNKGAMMLINESLQCSFTIISPDQIPHQ
jgi:serine/threonine-protein phosphatase PP1 catalytic subunit